MAQLSPPAMSRQYGVKVVGRIPSVVERFHAISVERRLKHPAVVAISNAAQDLLGQRETRLIR